MNIIFDSSLFIRFYEQPNQDNATIKDFVKNLFDIIILNPAINLQIPPIIYSEVATHVFYDLQPVQAEAFIQLLYANCKFVFDATTDMLDHINGIVGQRRMKGPADTLIIAWAIKERSILITGDEKQFEKAKRYFTMIDSSNVDCYNALDAFQRRIILQKVYEYSS